MSKSSRSPNRGFATDLGAVPKAPLSYKSFRSECIDGSAIDSSFFDDEEGTVKRIRDTGYWEPNQALNEKVSTQYQTHRPHEYGEIFMFVNEDGSAWQGKPQNPKYDSKKGKTRKYETPVGNGSRCFLPTVPAEIRQKIGERYGVEVPLEGSFWDWLYYHPEIPIILTEGGKKALSLLSKGYVAIALYGVHGGYQVKDPETKLPLIFPRLIPDLLRFCGEGRVITLAFDQDESSETRSTVTKALGKFGRLLVAAGCSVRVALWKAREGKGIDDAIVKAGDHAEAWLQAKIDKASTFEAWQKSEWAARMLQTVHWLNSNQEKPTRETTGEYLPPLAPLEPGTIDLIQAETNTGKTTQIRNLVKAKIGGVTVVYVPLNSLGKQLAKELDFPHASDYNKKDPDDVARFFALVKAKGGIVLCVDSIGILMDCNWLMESVDLVVIDEVNQVTANLAMGGTTKGDQARVLESFAQLLLMVIERGGSIIGAEAEIFGRTIDYLKALSCTNKVRLFTHTKSEFTPWDIELFEGSVSGYVRNLQQALFDDGKRIISGVTSQVMGEKLEKCIQNFADQAGLKCKILRIDSKTNDRGKLSAFFENPTEFLKNGQYDLVIYSPSAKSGVSIKEECFDPLLFDEVWGIFTTHHPDMWRQMVARYRSPVPRKIFIKPYILPSSGNERLCSVKGVRRRLDTNLNVFARRHGVDLAAGLMDAGDDAARLLEIESANAAYVAAETTALGTQKVIAKQYFIDLMESQGHVIREPKCGKDAATSTRLKLIQEELDREKSAILADLEEFIGEDGEPKAQLRILQDKYAEPDANDESDDPKAHLPTWIKNLLPFKQSWIEKAPGINFDDPETCYRHLVKDYGRQGRGVELQALSENLEAAQTLEKEEVEGILKGRLKLPHKLPKNYVKAKLIEITGVLALLDGETYHNDDARANAIKAAALKWKREIYHWLVLDIKDTQTPAEICNKLLGKLGLDAKAIARPGGKGKRDRIYQVPGLTDPFRMDLLNAMRRRLRWFDEASVADSLEMLMSVTGDSESLQAVWHTVQALPECDRKEIWARLSEDERQAVLRAVDEVAA